MELWSIDLMKKLLKVIESMSSTRHINGTRKYIELYYQIYGTRNKSIIELYFNKTIKSLKDY